MVRFDPTISYSDEASEIFSEYRKLKNEQEKKEKDRLSEPIGYATLKLNFLAEDMKERVETFFEENKHDFEYGGEIITREYYRKYLSKHFGKCFLDQMLIDFFKVNPEHKFKVMAIHEGFAVVESYSKAYIVPEEVIELVKKTDSVAVANELMVKADNQLTLASDLENAKELIEKVSNFEDEAFAGQLAAINNLKAEMEAKITAMYEMQAKMMAELQSKIQLYEHELLIMRSDLTAFEYRNGLTVDFMNIHKGANAPVHQPIIIHQKLIYLDEDLPRLTDLYDVDSGSLEVAIKNSPALLEHICPTSKGITFLKMRNSAGHYELENTVMKFIRNVMPNEVGVLIRNGENTWFTWLDSNDISLSTDSFTSKSSDEETSVSLLQSRYYLFNLIMGLIERNEILQLDHVPTNMFADPSIIWSSADSQIADSTYVELSKIIPILNRYSKADDPIYVLNSFADSAKYNGHYGGGHTERGRGDNALTDNTFVDKGLSKIKGIDYLSDFTYRFYVSGEKRSWWGDSKISPSLYIEEDEFINLKFLTSSLIDYYIHTKRIGKISNSGRYVDFSHMLPILFGIKEALVEQEKIDRLHIVAQDYDLNLLTSFKILHDVRVITPYQAKRYSKWVAGLSNEDKAYYKQLLLINDLDNVIRKPKVYAAITKPTLMTNEDRRERDTVDYAIFTIAEAGTNQNSIAVSKSGLNGWRTNYKTLTYAETELRYSYWNKASRIKTFSNQEGLDKLLKNEIIYQALMDRKSTKNFVLEDVDIADYFGEREWFLVDFFDRENNMELVKEVEKMNKELQEAKKEAKKEAKQK